MYQRRRVICAIVLLSGCILPGALYPYEQEINALASSLGEDIASAGKKTIAVVDFTDLQGSGLSCLLFVTNNHADRNLAIGLGGSRIIDDLGNEYPAKEVALGSQRTGWAQVVVTLVSGIRTRASIRFEGISPTPEDIALLEISCGSEGGSFKVQFRDVSPKGGR